MNRFRLLALTCLLACVAATALAGEISSRIAAVVNNDVVTTRELDQALAGQLAKAGAQPSAAQLGALRQETLSRLIEEKLVQQRIKALGLKVADAEVDEAVADVERQNRLSREQLEAALQGQGMTMSAYRENLRQQMLRYRLINQEVRSRVDVTEREVRDYYRAHLDEYRLPATVTLSAVTFPLPAQAGLAEREARQAAAREALGQAKAGESLDQVAAAYRETHGAVLTSFGTLAEAELSPELAAALAGVAPGGSTLVENAPALLLLKVEDRTAAGLRQFESLRPEITRILTEQKTEGRIRQWTQGLKQNAYIEIRP